MNFFNVFEDRIASIFGASSMGITMPFSFKKLAKKAAHEMENETYVIAGVDTAPALYTVLISETDDAAMRPVYPHLIKEIQQFIEAQAVSRSYSFVGKPLIRFMVDPSLKSGKFSVFAENIDADTLHRLQKEEEAYLSGKKPSSQTSAAQVGAAQTSSAQVNAAQAAKQARKVQAANQAYADAQQQGSSAVVRANMQPLSANMQQSAQRGARPITTRAQVMPVATGTAAQDGYQSYEDYDDSEAGLVVIPATDTQDSLVVGRPSPVVVRPKQKQAPEADDIAVADVPKTERRATAEPSQLEEDPYGTGAMQALAAERIAQEKARRSAGQIPATCLLIDRQTGRTYSAAAPSAIIGRERTSHGIVLHDPNVSRRHAELSCHDGIWVITDLNSTNGTLVNDVDVERCALRDGDMLTLGLVNLEFRAN